MEDRISREMSDAGIASTTGARSGRKYLTSASGNITYSMTLRDFLVIVSIGVGYDMTITLPSISGARGKIYAVKLIGTIATETIIVQDRDDGRGDLTKTSTATTGDKLVLLSDGDAWHILSQTGFDE